MMEPRIHRRVGRSRKKNTVPLSTLRTSEAVRTVVNHPRRLEELLSLLEERDIAVRGRAAETLARLARDYPRRLLRFLDKLRDHLRDDSAYVRWHLAYALGEVGAVYPKRAPYFLSELTVRMEDENRIVRLFARKAIESIAIRDPRMIEQSFSESNIQIPASVGRIVSKGQSGGGPQGQKGKGSKGQRED